MIELDIRSILLTGWLACFVGVLALSATCLNSNHRRYLGFVTCSNVTLMMGLALIMLRGIVPDTLSIIVGNTLAFVWAVLTWAACYRLLHRPFSWAAIILPIAVFAGLIGWYHLIQERTDVRILVYAVGFSLFMLLAAYQLIVRRHGLSIGSKGPALLIAGLCITYALLSLVRAWVTIGDTAPQAFLGSAPIHGVIVLVMFALHLALMLAFLWLSQRVTEIQLVNANEQANQASKVKWQFLSMLSHDLRTPLNIINGSIKGLRKDPLSESQAMWTEQAMHAVKSINRLANGVLELERPQKTAVTETLVVSDFVAELQGLYEPFIKSKGLEFSIRVAPDVASIWSLPAGKVSRVVMNLLDNGIRHTQFGSISIEIGVTDVTDSQFLTIRVSDTGCGIPQDEQSRIFTTFYQAAHKEPEKEGLGLGLSICKTLTDEMRGVLDVSSEVGQGTTFTLRLPSVFSSVQSALRKTSDCLNCIVVDDIAVNRMILAQGLNTHGHQVLGLDNGDQTIQALAINTDVVFLDMQLEHESGLDVVRQIRALPQSVGRVPVIGFSAMSLEAVRELYPMQEFDGFLTKPYRDAELSTALSNAMHHDRRPVLDAPTLANFRAVMGTADFSKAIEAVGQQISELLFEIGQSPEDAKLKSLHKLKGVAGLWTFHRVYRVASRFERQIQHYGQITGNLTELRYEQAQAIAWLKVHAFSDDCQVSKGKE